MLTDSGRQSAIPKEYWGHANLKGEKRQDSYYIRLIDKATLKLGHNAQAEFKFKFSNENKFEIKVKAGQILELMEGSRKVCEFTIQEIVNEKLK